MTKQRSEQLSHKKQRRTSKKTSPSKAEETTGMGKGSKRYYSTNTIAKLFALADNRCAYPGCTNEIVAAKTNCSDEAIVGQICHIHAAADAGPRGKPNLTKKERNSYENLILMCGHHHPLVDKQHADYPAQLLKDWKRKHEAKAQAGTAESIKQEENIQRHAFFEQASNDRIEKELLRIRQSRYIVGFKITDEAQTFATLIESQDYSAGSREVRARSLAWCARLLCYDNLALAERLLQISATLADTEEAKIAQAFILSIANTAGALKELHRIDSAASRSAALNIVIKKDGPVKAIDWFNTTELSADSLNAEGRFALILNALNCSKWAIAVETSDKVNEKDYEDCPALFHVIAMAKLVRAVPEEFRSLAISQVPFEADTFLLAADPASKDLLNEARALFKKSSDFARRVGIVGASNLASDFALWIGLRDPDLHPGALTELRASMGDPQVALRRTNLAFRFGLKLDVAAIERLIEKNMALSGGGTADEAFARFTLVFCQSSITDSVKYLREHKEFLLEHLDKRAVLGIEIELLAKANLLDLAQERFAEISKLGISSRDIALLEKIIAEAKGADPIAARRELYEKNRDIRALVNLVDSLEQGRLWEDLLPHAKELFAISSSVSSYQRVAFCLNNLGAHEELHQSLQTNASYISQSDDLRLLWAWSLYRVGLFSDADKQLQYIQKSNDANLLALQINLYIASGNWDKLLEFCNYTWNRRKECSAEQLLQAAQLSIAVKGPHSRELVETAVEIDQDNPLTLSRAYFLATTVGWDQNQTVSSWLVKAAALSGEDGPIKTMSLQEIVETKPRWDSHASNVWESLNSAKAPMFGAAQAINRSLLQLYLLPSFTNIEERDVRKRSILFAYSGARLEMSADDPKTLALDISSIMTFARLSLLEKVLARFEIIIPHSTLGWLFSEKQKAVFHQPSQIDDADELRQLIANGHIRVLQKKTATDINLSREVGEELASLLCDAKERSINEQRSLLVRPYPIYKVGTLMEMEGNIEGYADNVCSCYSVIGWAKKLGLLTAEEEVKARAYLSLHEKPWPNEPDISDCTSLYLDGLSLAHLRASGLLCKFSSIGIPVFVAEEEGQEANRLLALRGMEEKQLNIIEYIRKQLAGGLLSNHVRVTSASENDRNSDVLSGHPTYEVLGTTEKVDAIVIDDRFINQHSTMTKDAVVSPIYCTLDILELLQKSGEISEGEHYAYRTTLRQAGYQLIAVKADELTHHLQRAGVSDGILIETAELKAIRESLLRARMNKLVQIPSEINFLHQSLCAFSDAIKNAWLSRSSFEEAAAVSEYLVDQMDPRFWAGSALAGNERNFAISTYSAYIRRLISLFSPMPKPTRAAFNQWVTDRVLLPIKEYQPDVFQGVVSMSRTIMLAINAELYQTTKENG